MPLVIISMISVSAMSEISKKSFYAYLFYLFTDCKTIRIPSLSSVLEFPEPLPKSFLVTVAFHNRKGRPASWWARRNRQELIYIPIIAEGSQDLLPDVSCMESIIKNGSVALSQVFIFSYDGVMRILKIPFWKFCLILNCCSYQVVF